MTMNKIINNLPLIISLFNDHERSLARNHEYLANKESMLN